MKYKRSVQFAPFDKSRKGTLVPHRRTMSSQGKYFVSPPSRPFFLCGLFGNRALCPKGFSLLELLTVMAILAITTTLLIPAVGNFSKAGKLTSAGNQLTSLATQARQNSITKGALTALLLANEGSGSRRAVSLWELRPRDDGSIPQSSDWVQASKWMVLPEGTAVDTQKTKLADQNASLVPALPSLRYNGASLRNYALVIFKPDGSLFPIGNVAVPRLRIVEGLIENASTIRYTRPGAAEGEPANFYDITLLPASGRLKIDRS